MREHFVAYHEFTTIHNDVTSPIPPSHATRCGDKRDVFDAEIVFAVAKDQLHTSQKLFNSNVANRVVVETAQKKNHDRV